MNAEQIQTHKIELLDQLAEQADVARRVLVNLVRWEARPCLISRQADKCEHLQQLFYWATQWLDVLDDIKDWRRSCCGDISAKARLREDWQSTKPKILD